MTDVEIDVAQWESHLIEPNLIEAIAKKRPDNDSIESLPGL